MAVRLKGPTNHGGFGFRGESFIPDENGHIDVPNEALDEAFSHGFAVTDEQPAPIPTAAEVQATNFAKLNKKQLVAFGKDNLGLELDEGKTAKELIAEIEAAQAAKAAELAAKTAAA